MVEERERIWQLKIERLSRSYPGDIESRRRDGNDLGRGKLKNMYKFNCLREFSQKKLKKTSHYFVYSHRDIR